MHMIVVSDDDTRSTIMSSIHVTEPTEDQEICINNLCSLLSTRSDLSFIDRFNFVEIIDMIDICQQARLYIRLKNCVHLVFYM